MAWPVSVNEWLDQIEHLHQFRIVESPDSSLRSQFDISCTVLPHDVVLNCVEFETRRTVDMCRSHRGLKHAHPITIGTYENHIVAPVKI